MRVEAAELVRLVAGLGDPPPVAEAVHLLGEVDEAAGGDDGGEHELRHLVDSPAPAVGPVVVIRAPVSHVLHQPTPSTLKEDNNKS